MLIVEDGTGKSDANTYISLDELKAYLSLRAITNIDDSTLSAAIIKAADYLETCVTGEWIGEEATTTQAMAWPRIKRNFYTGQSETLGVPDKLKRAQCLLAATVIDGTDIMPVKSANGTMIEETIGPITTKYADTSKIDGSLPTIAGLDGLLSGLLGSGGYFPLKGVRV